MNVLARPEYHNEKERDRLFKNALSDPENGVRDHAILRLLYGAPVRPLEAARLMTHDLVSDKGRVIDVPVFELRKEIAFNGRERPIPIANKKLIEALQLWINFRLRYGWGLTKTGYIDLSKQFFMRNKIEGFKIVTTNTNGVSRHNNDNFNRTVRRRFEINKIPGSVESALRTWTLDRHREERCIRRIWAYRGDADIATVKSVIAKDPVRLGAMVEYVY